MLILKSRNVSPDLFLSHSPSDSGCFQGPHPVASLCIGIPAVLCPFDPIADPFGSAQQCIRSESSYTMPDKVPEINRSRQHTVDVSSFFFSETWTEERKESQRQTPFPFPTAKVLWLHERKSSGAVRLSSHIVPSFSSS